MIDQSTLLVSVCLITYNHEKYIRQAIESIISQKTDFPFEIVIGDDNSTDATQKIILEYKEKYPQLIKLAMSSTNRGMNKNFINTLEQCQGKYIAMLEGDDYWISTKKLAKQVAFLEQNLECTICFHKVEVYIEETDCIRGVWPESTPADITTINDLLQDNYIHTSTVMYRNVRINETTDKFYELGIVDWPIHVLYAQKGKVGFLNEVMARYKIHSMGIFSSLPTIKKYDAVLKTREYVYPILHKGHQKILGPVILDYFYQLVLMSLESNDLARARSYLLRGSNYSAYFIHYKNKFQYLILCIRVYFPRIYTFFLNVKHALTKIIRS